MIPQISPVSNRRAWIFPYIFCRADKFARRRNTQQISQKIDKKVIDFDTPLCYDGSTCEKGFFCALFSAPER